MSWHTQPDAKPAPSLLAQPVAPAPYTHVAVMPPGAVLRNLNQLALCETLRRELEPSWQDGDSPQ